MPDKDISISPSSWVPHAEQDITPDSLRQDMMEQFSKKEGSFSIVIMKMKKDGSPNSFAVETEQRKFHFDPENWAVRFETYFETMIKVLTAPLDRTEESDAYFVSLTWNDPSQEMAIYVSQSGELKKFSTFQTVNLILRPSWKPTHKPSSTAY